MTETFKFLLLDVVYLLPIMGKDMDVLASGIGFWLNIVKLYAIRNGSCRQ